MERLRNVFTILKAISEECVAAGRSVGRVACLALLHLDIASLGTRVQAKGGHTLRTRWVCAIRHGAWVLSAFALILMALPSGALALTFTTIDVPGAMTTSSTAINAAGQIVGFYTDSRGTGHGFVTQKGHDYRVERGEAVAGALLGDGPEGMVN